MSEQPQSAIWSVNLKRGFVFTGSGAMINLIFLMLETIIAARLVSTSGYGIYTLLVTLVNFLVVMADFGGKTAVTQMLAGSTAERQAAIVNSVVVFRLAMIAIIGAVIWLAQGPLTMLDSTPGLVRYLGYLPLMLLGASLDELLFGMLQGFHSYRHIAAALVLRSVLRLGLTAVLLVVFQLGTLALIYSWIISFAASSIYQYLALPTTRRASCQRAMLAEMLRFGFPLQMTRFLWLGFRRVDVLLLGTLAGPAGVAFYAVASRIPDALQRMSESYIAVFFPTMSTLLKSSQRGQAHQMMNQSLRLISFISALMAIGGVVYSRPITLLLFSEKYIASAPILAVLMLGFHITIVVNLMGYTLTAAGYPGRSLGENLVRTGLNVLGDLLLIPIYGFAGPAFATLISTYASNPLAIWLLQRSGNPVEVRPYAIQSLILLLCAGMFWLVQGGLIFGTTIVVIFIILNILLSTISYEDLRMLISSRQTNLPGVAQESLSNGS
jgi:O-antigen/teichoic acid export membrane protein